MNFHGGISPTTESMKPLQGVERREPRGATAGASVFRWALMLGAVAIRLSAQPLTPPAFSIARDVTAVPSPIIYRAQAFVAATDGFIYGGSEDRPVSSGGATIFRLAAGGTGYTVIRSMTAREGLRIGALIQCRDGRLYGAAQGGGASNVWGTLFSLNLDGTGFTVLHDFISVVTEGGTPSGLVEGADGRLYGTAISGGINGSGAIFRLNRDGSGFSVLRSLATLSDGAGPYAGLIQGPDGGLFGAALFGGANDRGTVFRISVDGTGFTVLRHMNPTEGGSPVGRLLLSGGKLYGVTAAGGGTFGGGTIYRMNLDGSGFTVLRTLDSVTGRFPSAGMIQARDGMFYGNTTEGGVVAGGNETTNGTIYRFNPSNAALDVLWNYRWNVEGTQADTELAQGADLQLYSATHIGGVNNGGTIFSFSLTPQLASAAVVNGKVGEVFSYRVVGTNSPQTYSAAALPLGLGFTSATGVIAGTPKVAGSFSVTVGATNVSGTTTATLRLNFDKGDASVALSNLLQVADGAPKPATIVTVPAGLAVTTTYGGSSSAPTEAGTYSVVSTVTDPNYTGSASGTLVILAKPAINSQSVSLSTIAGTNGTLSASVSGSAPLNYQWQRLPVGSSTWSDLVNGPSYSNVGTATLGIISPNLSMNGDRFRLVVTNAAGSITSGEIPLTVWPSNRLLNFSIGTIITPGQPLTVGFVTSAGPRSLLVRAIGPGLAPFVGSGTALAADPTLTLYRGSTPVGTNDNWGGTVPLANAFAKVGAFGLAPNSLDAALLADVNGSHTLQMTTTTAGFGLIEAYDLGIDTTVRVINFSTLCQLKDSTDTLTAGFVVAGTGPKTLLIRGIGPGLTAYGVASPLADPKIDVFDGASKRLTGNDDWTPSLAATFASAGAFALAPGSKDSALVFVAQPGSYTVQLTSGGGSAGLVLIEVYELSP